MAKLLIKYIAYAGAFWTFISGILGSGVSFFTDYHVPLYVRSAVEIAGWMFLLSASIMILSLIVYYMYILCLKLYIFAEGKLNPPVHYSYKSCTKEDVRKIVSIGKSVFGEQSTTLSEALSIHKLDKTAFKALKSGKGEIKGYTCILCLTAEGARLIRDGNFDVKRINTTVLSCGSGKSYDSVYIGAVWGHTALTQGRMVGALGTFLEERQPKVAYARAATREGLERLQQERFRPLGGAASEVGVMFYKSNPRGKREKRKQGSSSMSESEGQTSLKAG